MVLNSNSPFARLDGIDQMKVFRLCKDQHKMSTDETIAHYNVCDDEGRTIILDVARAEYP